MKKTLVICTALIIFAIFLIQCNRTTFGATTLAGTEFQLEASLDLRMAALDRQGNFIEGAYFDDDETRALLEEFRIELPEIPIQEFTFQIELISYEFDRQGRNQLLPEPASDLIVATSDGQIDFPDITFEDAGLFVYNIQQVSDATLENWALDDSSQRLTIRVSQDLQAASLVVEVEEVVLFTNRLEYDISEEVQQLILSQWETHVAQVCEDPDMTPILDAIERYGDSVSIFFENLETGCTFRHNAERNFFAASTTKAPFALWLYTLADQGEIDLDATLTFGRGNLMMGAGIIRHEYEFGQEIPIRRLIALNLYESDNVATQMLRHEFGYHGYANFIASLGGTRDFARDIWNSRLTADEAGFFMREIFNYIEGGHPHSEEFREHLLNNRLPHIVSDYPVASKSGQFQDFGGAWHDMAIVYAPSPYILVILSSRTGTEEDYRVYHYISQAFQEFNQLNFIEPWLD